MSMADANRFQALEERCRRLEERVEQLEETVRDLVAAMGPPLEPARTPQEAAA